MPSSFAKLLELLALIPVAIGVAKTGGRVKKKNKEGFLIQEMISKSLPNFTWQILCFANF
jgi:hypothetical protein